MTSTIRARIAATFACVVTASLAASCTSSSDGGSGRHAAPHAPSVRVHLTRPGQFIAVRFAPKGQRGSGPDGFIEVAVSSVRTGAVLRRLLPGSRDGMTVEGLSVDRSGNLWITYSRGPVYRSDTMGGDPKPRSCRNEIAILHASTGRLSVFLRTADNVLIGGAAVSPAGRLLAYSESGCATGYFNSYLRITNLGTGRSWSIGHGLARCHFITAPAWALDGRALLVVYAPHAGRPYTGPQGSCAGIGPERLVELSPAAQPGLDGQGFSAGRGCQITSVAPAIGGGALAIKACGGQDDISGPARLLILDAHFRQLRQVTLGRCTDGNELSTGQSGRIVLISAYLFCNPPGRPGPITRLWSYNRGKLRLITSVPGGTLAISFMTW